MDGGAKAWIDHEVAGCHFADERLGKRLRTLLNPYPADEMEKWRVSDAARNPRNETAEIIKPIR